MKPLLLLLLLAAPAVAGWCQPGAKACPACVTCTRCVYCSTGRGSCSVCRDKAGKRPSKPLPALPPGTFKP